MSPEVNAGEGMLSYFESSWESWSLSLFYCLLYLAFPNKDILTQCMVSLTKKNHRAGVDNWDLMAKMLRNMYGVVNIFLEQFSMQVEVTRK